MATIDEVSVSQLIETRRRGAAQMAILLWSLALMFVEGYDMQTMSYAAPAILREWHVSKALFGPVFSASLFGYLIGALLVSNLSDRFGRKSAILLGLVVYGVFTFAAGRAGNLETLMTLRFLAGVGLGGTIPAVIALNAEYVPLSARATRISVLFIGYTAGTAIGGFFASYAIPHFGWPSIFYVGGILPLLLAAGVALRLPESIRFLAVTGRHPAQLAATVRRLYPERNFSPDTRFLPGEPLERGVPVRHLFTEGRSVMTVLLWLSFILSLVGHYFLLSWLPTLLVAGGLPLHTAVIGGALFMTGGMVGTLLLGLAMDRWGMGMVAVTFIVATPLVIAIGFVQSAEVPLMVLIFLAGVFLIGGQGGLNALSGILYPTFVRSTGSGWALGVGRVGSMLGPVIGGFLISDHMAMPVLFAWAGLPALLCAGTLLLVMRTRQGAAIEQARLDAVEA